LGSAHRHQRGDHKQASSRYHDNRDEEDDHHRQPCLLGLAQGRPSRTDAFFETARSAAPACEYLMTGGQDF